MATRIFFLVLILLAIDIYAFQAVRVLAQNWSSTGRNVLYGIYWSITVLAFGTMLAAVSTDVNQWNKALFTIIRAILFITYFSKLLVAGVMLLDDLRRLLTGVYDYAVKDAPFNPGRSRFMSQVALIIGGLPFTSLTYGILRNPYRYKKHQKTVEIENLPEALEGFKIVQISDIHSGSFTFKEPVKNSVAMINEENPDLVFFTGDLVNSIATEAEPYIDVFDKIRAKHGVFSVFGNHDYGDYASWPSQEAKRENLKHLESIHARMGWQLLRNENRILDINGAKLAVIGVENYSASPRFQKYGDLPKAYRGAENADLKLLLSHDPSHWDDQVNKDFKDIALTFSGHTHGFQFGIEIPGWLRWSPSQYVYKQWAGLYQEGKQFLYVNRGLGFLGYPGRVGILPEVTVITLKKKTSI